MKLRTIIAGMYLAVAVFGVAADAIARTDLFTGKTAVPAEKVVDFLGYDPGVSPGSSGSGSDSSGKDAAGDCCSGSSDYDPATGVKQLAGKIQLLAVKPCSLSERFALPDPSYPVMKPPQNQSV